MDTVHPESVSQVILQLTLKSADKNVNKLIKSHDCVLGWAKDGITVQKNTFYSSVRVRIDRPLYIRLPDAFMDTEFCIGKYHDGRVKKDVHSICIIMFGNRAKTAWGSF